MASRAPGPDRVLADRRTRPAETAATSDNAAFRTQFPNASTSKDTTRTEVPQAATPIIEEQWTAALRSMPMRFGKSW